MFAQRISGPLSSDVVVVVVVKVTTPLAGSVLSLLCATFLTLQMQTEDRQEQAGRSRNRTKSYPQDTNASSAGSTRHLRCLFRS